MTPGHLIIAFERGFNTLQGAMIQEVTSWGMFKQVVRELKKSEVKEVYKSLVIDTADVAADACQKYVCNQLGIENIGDGGWKTNGWAKYKKEFEETFRELAQLGYSIIFISHDKEKTISPQNAPEYQQITSSLQTSAQSIVENMCDMILYAHLKVMPDGDKARVLTIRSLDDSVRCGSRFKYMKAEIPFSYDSLVTELNRAIDEEARANDNKFVTDEKLVAVQPQTYDYEGSMKHFSELVNQLMGNNEAYYGPRITAVVDKYLGKGKKVSEATIDQVELIALINSEIEDELIPTMKS